MKDEPAHGGGPTGEGAARAPEAQGAGRGPELARELGGDLPCASCRYNLRGLSVRSVCPECGTPVRATILARVDPYASVLRPISWPRATAAGLLVWSVGALAAGVLTWVMRLGDMLGQFAQIEVNLRWAARLGAVCIGVSAVGALALVRPHAGMGLGKRWAAGLGVAATGACAWVYWRMQVVFDSSHATPYLEMDRMAAERTELRLWFGGLMIAALLGLRLNARVLAGRSLLVRMGHVEHQTMMAMVAAVGAGMLGDVLHLAGPHATGTVATMAGWIGSLLIAVASMLMTVGLVGIVVDSVRLAPVVLRPPLSIGSVMGRDPGGVA